MNFAFQQTRDFFCKARMSELKRADIDKPTAPSDAFKIRFPEASLPIELANLDLTLPVFLKTFCVGALFEIGVTIFSNHPFYYNVIPDKKICQDPPSLIASNPGRSLS